ncbi:MAG: hydantoinase/oxoprolinase family protein [Bacillota bacterium]
MFKSTGNSSPWTLAVDTGSTFTDACLYSCETGKVYTAKVGATPGNPSQSVLKALDMLCRMAGIGPEKLGLFLHGSSLEANAVISKALSKTALLTTKGFRDILFGRSFSYTYLSGLSTPGGRPLIRRCNVYEIDERILAGGVIQKPLDIREVAGLIPILAQKGFQSIAVCFLHSHINPVHEQMAGDVLSEIFPPPAVTLSSDVLPVQGELERFGTTVITASIRAYMAKYIDDIRQYLDTFGHGRPEFHIVKSDGGTVPSSSDPPQCGRAIFSGAAAGVLSGVHLSRTTGRQKIISLDMGGTSTDISIISGGQPEYRKKGYPGGYPLGFPMLDIVSISIGGGSIARIDDGGALKVGPESAGAYPGPVCFNRGGCLPTCTDANLILGRLGADSFRLVGINPDNASTERSIMSNIAVKTGMSVESAAEGIISAANSIIAGNIRIKLAEKGFDPGELALVAFGGDGPLHAAELARDLCVPIVLIPPHPGANSALGMLFSNISTDYHIEFVSDLLDTDPGFLDSQYGSMEERAIKEFAARGRSDMEMRRSANLRCSGYPLVINMTVPSGKLTRADLALLNRAFKITHQEEFGFIPENSDAEIVSLGLTVSFKKLGGGPEFHGQTRAFGNKQSQPLPISARSVYFQGRWLETPVYSRDEIQPSVSAAGPAIIEQDYCSTLVWPGMKFSADSFGNIVIDVGVS